MVRISCAVVIVALSFLMVRSDAGQVPSNKSRNPETIEQNAQNIVSKRRQIAGQLAEIVADETAPIKQRFRMGELLGELHYAPAIPLLIRHIDIVDPTIESSEERPDLQYPLMIALASFGDAAVPDIVDAFLAERDRGRQFLLFLVIEYGKTKDNAIRYLRGTEPPDEKDWLKKQNTEQLEKFLTERQSVRK